MNFIKTAKNLLLKISGTSYSIPTNDPTVPDILDAIRSGATEDEILDKVDVRRTITKEFDGVTFDIDEQNGSVLIDGEVVPDCIGRRLTEYSEASLVDRIRSIVSFWKKLRENPDKRIQTDLFKFLEYNSIPLCTDGCFLGYKSVWRNPNNNNLYDSYTKTILNNPGETVKMDRSSVNADPFQTCSHGLHVADHSYADSMYRGGEYVMVSLKVDPRNCVSVPVDYNGRKLRVCEYTVVEILQEREKFEVGVVDDDSMFISVYSTSDWTKL